MHKQQQIHTHINTQMHIYTINKNTNNEIKTHTHNSFNTCAHRQHKLTTLTEILTKTITCQIHTNICQTKTCKTTHPQPQHKHKTTNTNNK